MQALTRALMAAILVSAIPGCALEEDHISDEEAEASLLLADNEPFLLRAVHGGGGGAIAAQVQGSLTWLNRSVTVNNPRLFVIAGECAEAAFNGSQGGIGLHRLTYTRCNRTSTGKTYDIGTFTLDGSEVAGGIGTVNVSVLDRTHFLQVDDDFER
jgi:hypothetical protein